MLENSNFDIENTIDLISQEKRAKEEYQGFAKYVGQGLLVTRHLKKLSLEEASFRTKIPVKEIEKIELGQTQKFELDKICLLLASYNERFLRLL
jgi:hypothetical protein